MTPQLESPDISELGTALLDLRTTQPELAGALARALGVVTREAGRNPRFARSLAQAVAGGEDSRSSPPRRTGRRAPGVIDPFAVYSDGGEETLRARLSELSLDQLRDIVAEHAMDHDRLAMKWKAPNRVIERILDKVKSRSTKGSAFR